MTPDRRPDLHYVLERADNPELRDPRPAGANYQWPISGGARRDVQLQWVAADPVAYDPAVYVASAWSGASGVIDGRTYDVHYDRDYSSSGGGAPGPLNAVIHGDGDLPIQPFLDIYGPATKPWVSFTSGASHWGVVFVDGFRIDAGERVSVDTVNHLAYRNGDPTQSVIGSVDFNNTDWPVLPPRTDVYLSLIAQGANYLTQVSATWQDGYLS